MVVIVVSELEDQLGFLVIYILVVHESLDKVSLKLFEVFSIICLFSFLGLATTCAGLKYHQRIYCIGQQVGQESPDAQHHVSVTSIR